MWRRDGCIGVSVGPSRRSLGGISRRDIIWSVAAARGAPIYSAVHRILLLSSTQCSSPNLLHSLTDTWGPPLLLIDEISGRKAVASPAEQR